MRILSKETVLENSAQGFAVFQFYLQPYYPTGIKEGLNIPNPFLSKTQATGSFNVFRSKNEQWFFKDFAHPECKGDCFELVRLARPELKNAPFVQVLRTINQDLQLGLIEQNNAYSQHEASTTPLDFKERTFSSAELSYWESYGITLDVLKKYGVKALESFTTLSAKNGKEYTVRSTPDNPIFAFKYSNALKVYRPLSKNKRFKWRYLGERISSFIFGFEQLADNTPIVILTSGEKDVLSLAAQGFPAICLNSETSSLNSEQIERIHTKAERIVICYDNDNTGKKQAQALAEEFELAYISLPHFEGKDISDFFKSGFSAKDFQELLNLAIHLHDATLILRTSSSDLPTFGEQVYKSLPDGLSKILSHQKDAKLSDVLLLGMLTLAGAAMPNILTQNVDKANTPDLYSIIIGDFASGKGELSKARQAGSKLDQYLIETSREKYEAWKQEQQGNNSEKPKTKPPYIDSFYTSGDISTTAIKQKLQESEGRAFIFETEIDTLNGAFRQTWGDFSDMLRKAFHHEAITMQRVQKADTEVSFLNIPTPSISLLLSGTPNQLMNLLSSGGVKNGLYSRMLMYFLHGEEEWISRRPTEQRSKQDEQIIIYAGFVKRMWQSLRHRKPISIELTDEQFSMIDSTFGALYDVWKKHSAEIGAMTKRSALMAQRIAVILSVHRLFKDEKIEDSDLFFCSDAEVQVGCQIARVCFLHSAFFGLTRLIKKDTPSEKKESVLRLSNNGMSIRAIAKELSVPKSTVSDWVKKSQPNTS